MRAVEALAGSAARSDRHDRLRAIAAAFRQVAVVPRLPKTRSGKVLRGTMKKIADGETVATPATIDDPAILEEIRVALEKLGYPAVREREATD